MSSHASHVTPSRSTRVRLTRRQLLVGVGATAASGLLALSGGAAWAAAPAPARRAAPALQTPKYGGEVTWALESDPVNLAPFGVANTSNQWGKEFMYDSLLAWDQNLNPQAALAESWETPDDKTWIWHLRSGLKFHNGDPVTAADVKYSIELQANPPAPGIQVAQYPKIAGVDVIDERTARFTMSGPDPTVLGYLAWSRYSSIIPQGAYDKWNLLTTGIGTGPFKLVEFVANDRVVYAKNPDFWKSGLPYIDGLTLKVLPDENSRVAALRSGAIHGCTVSADTAKTLANDSGITLLKGLYSEPRVFQLGIKGDGKPWDKKAVRQALSMALDRQAMIDNVYGGEAVLTGPVVTGYGDWFIPPEELASKWYKRDVEGAKKLLADAGFGSGFQITAYAISSPNDYTQIAEVAREQLKEIGVDVQVVSEEIGSIAKRAGDGNYEILSTGRGSRHDVTGYIVDFGRPTEGAAGAWFNKGQGWKSDQMSALFEQALVNLDQPSRHQQIRQFQELFMDEMPNVYTVQPYKFHAVRSELKDMYVAFSAFITGLRMVWLDR